MRLDDLQHNERVDAMQTLHKGGGNTMIYSKLTTSVGDYRDVDIKDDSVIYCDIPYFQSRQYKHNKEAFDYEAFYEWCEKQEQLVIISEYWMPEDRFVRIAEKARKSSFSATNNSLERIERLFVPKRQYERYQVMMSKQIGFMFT